MDRPYTTIHILSALDGKIAGSFSGTEGTQKAGVAYGRIRTELNAKAWLYGTITTMEYTGFRKPRLRNDAMVPDGDYAAVTDAELYYISVDTAGKIGWESGTFRKAGRPDSHVIEVLTESTDLAYRSYLRERGVSYILAGREELDCKIAMEKLKKQFDIDSLLICGGGGVNWSFLQANVVDELSLVLAPAADGDPNSVTVFERMKSIPASVPVEFQLKDLKRLDGDTVWLRYLVKS